MKLSMAMLGALFAAVAAAVEVAAAEVMAAVIFNYYKYVVSMYISCVPTY